MICFSPRSPGLRGTLLPLTTGSPSHSLLRSIHAMRTSEDLLEDHYLRFEDLT